MVQTVPRKMPDKAQDPKPDTITWKDYSNWKRKWRTQKGSGILKKSGGILCGRDWSEAYRFINGYHGEFGIRWLLRRLSICPNAYYNYRKHRKSDHYAKKSEVLAQIEEIYHSHNGVDGYRSMTFYLERRGYGYSAATIHRYMDTELGLRSVVRPKKPDHGYSKPHKVFENKLKQDPTADAVDQKWCTDLTYLFLADHEVRYNCTIIDLYDRSVAASMTDRSITSDLAIRTLQKSPGSPAADQRGTDPPQRSGFPIYIQGICGVLRICICPI